MNKRPRAKLTPSQVSRIRQYLEQGWTLVGLAAKYGVGPKTIANIKSGRTWTALKERNPVLPGEK